MNTIDDCRPALRDRCPIDLSILTRWFLEHDGDSGEVDCPRDSSDAVREQEVAA